MPPRRDMPNARRAVTRGRVSGDRLRARRGPSRAVRLTITLAAFIAIFAGAAWGISRLVARPGLTRVGSAESSSTTDTTSVAKAAVEAAIAQTRASIVIGSFLGDQNRRTYGVGPAPERLDLIWKIKLGSGPTQRKLDNKLVSWSGNGWTGQCTVVSEAGRDYLLVGAYDHNLRRIDAETGQVIWATKFDDVIKSTNTVFANPHPTGADDRIIVTAGSRRGSSYKVGDPRIAPFRAVSFATGKELWRFPIPKTPQYSQDVDSSSLLVGDTLYTPVESGYVYGLDPSSTKPWMDWASPVVRYRSPELWTADDVARHKDIGGANIAIEASPARIGDTLYIASGSGHIYGLSLPDLKVVWDYRTGSDIDGTTAVTRGGKLLVTLEKQYIAGDGGALLLDPKKKPSEATVWFSPTDGHGIAEWEGGSVGSVSINDESNKDGARPALAAFNSVNGSMYVVSQDTMSPERAKGFDGKSSFARPVEVYRARIGASISTPIIVDDTIISAGYDNRVHAFKIRYLEPSAKGPGVVLKAADGTSWKVRVEPTATFKAGGAFEATPLVLKGRVYIGCRDGWLYCLGAR